MNSRRFGSYPMARPNPFTSQTERPVSATFTFDTSSPTVSITLPVSPPVLPAYSNLAESSRTLTGITGAASDSAETNNSGVVSVEIAISSGTGENDWWDNGSGDFDQSQATVFFSTSLAGPFASWTYGPAALISALSDGQEYRAYVRVADAAGNQTGFVVNPGDVGQVRQRFAIDETQPLSVIQAPSQTFHNASLTTLSGTASEAGPAPSGLLEVELAVQENPPSGSWWEWGPCSRTTRLSPRVRSMGEATPFRLCSRSECQSWSCCWAPNRQTKSKSVCGI